MKKKPYLQNEKDSSDVHLSKKDTNLSIAAVNILVCFLICGGVGYFADKHYGTDKWTVVGIFVGLFIGFYHFIKFIIDAMRDK